MASQTEETNIPRLRSRLLGKFNAYENFYYRIMESKEFHSATERGKPQMTTALNDARTVFTSMMSDADIVSIANKPVTEQDWQIFEFLLMCLRQGGHDHHIETFLEKMTAYSKDPLARAVQPAGDTPITLFERTAKVKLVDLKRLESEKDS